MEKLFNHVYQRAKALKNKPVKPIIRDELSGFDLALDLEAYEGQLEDLINSIIDQSINTQSPRFLNQLYGGSSEHAWLGELLVAVLNTSMATEEIAPLATKMELEIIRAIKERVCFSKAQGLFVPGGSYANMMGIHCARAHKFPEAKQEGLFGQQRLKVFVSKDAHYSSSKSMNLMGLGTDNLVKIELDKNRRINVKALQYEIEKTIKEGEIPLCVVSTAGTTVWGAFDPIYEIQELCEKFKIWHHVDAAWGGLVLWSEQNRNKLFKGIEKVDSVTLDFHKLMASTLTKGLFITSHPEILRNANSGGGEAYIFQNETANDTGRYALQCGRKVDALPLWLQWKIQGDQSFKNKIDEFFELSNWFVNKLKGYPEIKILHEVEFLNHCFQLIPSKSKFEIGDFNRRIRERVMERGNFMVNFAMTEEHGDFFRVVFNHWGVNQSILEELLKEIFLVMNELENQ